MSTRHTLSIILLLVLSFPSSADNISARLNLLEKEMNIRPDSVLLELGAMSPGTLRGPGNKALHSLLLSQALDKNGHDIKSDSLIAPAVQYFSKKGAPARRLRMNYYRGRISENAGDPDGAMEWFKKGETFVGKCSDYATAGRLYSHKSALYYNIYDYSDALTNATTASEFFLKESDTLSYSYRRLDIARITSYRGILQRPKRASKGCPSSSPPFPNLVRHSTSAKDSYPP